MIYYIIWIITEYFFVKLTDIVGHGISRGNSVSIESNYSVLIVLFVCNTNKMKSKHRQGKTEEMLFDCA